MIPDYAVTALTRNVVALIGARLLFPIANVNALQ